MTAKERRQKAEKDMLKDKKYPKYPTWEAVEAENQEAEPAVYVEISDASGSVINRVAGKTKKGIHRITWDMTHANERAVTGEKVPSWRRNGITAMPGVYTATLFKRVGAEVTQLAEPVKFELQSIYEAALTGASAEEMMKFRETISAERKRSSMTNAVLKQVAESMKFIRTAIDRTPGDIAALEKQYAEIQSEKNAIDLMLNGLKSRDRQGAKPANINSRLGYAMSGVRSSYGPTKQHHEQLGYATEGLNEVIQRVKALQEVMVPGLQKAIIEAGGPWTKGAPIAI